MITTGPLGKIITGSVLDVARKPLERILKDYDPFLYLKWNPRKLKGNGTWELRRSSGTKGVTNVVQYQGCSIVKIDWYENNFINHVKDFAYLNYGILSWVKEHDLWDKGIQRHNVVAQAERNLDTHNAEQARKNKEQMAYELRQYNREWEDLKEYASTPGQTIADICQVWEQAKRR